VRDASEIERAIAAFARANSGLVVIGSAVVAFHRHRIIALAARDKLPAVYQERSYVDGGGSFPMGPISSTSTGARLAARRFRFIRIRST